MTHVREFLADQPVLVLFALLAIGTLLGKITVRGVGLGPAGVLFAALALSAIDPDWAVPEIVGTLGLSLFAYAVGIVAGPSFFGGLRRGIRPIALVAGALIGVGALTYALGRVLGFSSGTIAGLYAGANTNTPGLAAAIVRLNGSPEPTVGYSLSYIGGVLVMLLTTAWLLRRGQSLPDPEPEGTSPAMTTRTVEITHDNVMEIRELRRTPYGEVLFSRHRTPDGEMHMAAGSTVLRPGDLVHIVGARASVDHLTKQLGRASDEVLTMERDEFDFRRIVVSNKALFGKTIGELHLWDRFMATPTRVRRADQDFLAAADLHIQPGDRIRVTAPADQMAKVAKYLGDSEHAISDINPLGLATGMTLGLLLGIVPFAIPGLGTLHLGAAAGPLLVGLVVGRLGRSGPMLWTLPHSGAETLTQLGLLLFLAYAGGRAGSQVVTAITSPLGIKIVLAGLVVTAAHAAVLVVGVRRLSMAAPRVAGLMAGSQTQPAILAYANENTTHDPRVTMGYALVYPVAMVVKIVICQILTII
ncbi:aspartate:alanine exchanger family transporter [Nostocoides veronense]|uniref:Aspartate:alanine exchanger family transporter n=1 Tax=Nostocoides veronense TaxID=330836 RepID=A0ABN2M5E2_9MICO